MDEQTKSIFMAYGMILFVALFGLLFVLYMDKRDKRDEQKKKHPNA
jgi:hypothetical protein